MAHHPKCNGEVGGILDSWGRKVKGHGLLAGWAALIAQRKMVADSHVIS